MTTARDRQQADPSETLDGERGLLVALLVMVVLGVAGILVVSA